jgi:hypothetical protein
LAKGCFSYVYVQQRRKLSRSSAIFLARALLAREMTGAPLRTSGQYQTAA